MPSPGRDLIKEILLRPFACRRDRNMIFLQGIDNCCIPENLQPRRRKFCKNTCLRTVLPLLKKRLLLTGRRQRKQKENKEQPIHLLFYAKINYYYIFYTFII
jgi:hypothetical protein